MIRRILFAGCALGALSGCYLTPYDTGTRISEGQWRPVSGLESLYLLPQYGNARVIDIAQRNVDNGVEQRIVLANDTALPGQNYINVKVFRRRRALSDLFASDDFSIEPARYTARSVDRRLVQEFPSLPAEMAQTERLNRYGGYRFAVAQGRGAYANLTCVFAWQVLGGDNPSLPSEVRSVEIEYRNCAVGRTPEDLLADFDIGAIRMETGILPVVAAGQPPAGGAWTTVPGVTTTTRPELLGYGASSPAAFPSTVPQTFGGQQPVGAAGYAPGGGYQAAPPPAMQGYAPGMQSYGAPSNAAPGYGAPQGPSTSGFPMPGGGGQAPSYAAPAAPAVPSYGSPSYGMPSYGAPPAAPPPAYAAPGIPQTPGYGLPMQPQNAVPVYPPGQSYTVPPSQPYAAPVPPPMQQAPQTYSDGDYFSSPIVPAPADQGYRSPPVYASPSPQPQYTPYPPQQYAPYVPYAPSGRGDTLDQDWAPSGNVNAPSRMGATGASLPVEPDDEVRVVRVAAFTQIAEASTGAVGGASSSTYNPAPPAASYQPPSIGGYQAAPLYGATQVPVPPAAVMPGYGAATPYQLPQQSPYAGMGGTAPVPPASTYRFPLPSDGYATLTPFGAGGVTGALQISPQTVPQPEAVVAVLAPRPLNLGVLPAGFPQVARGSESVFRPQLGATPPGRATVASYEPGAVGSPYPAGAGYSAYGGGSSGYSAACSSPPSAAAYGGAGYFQRTLMLQSPRMVGPDVTALQCFLQRTVFSAIRVDGIFGTETDQTLRRWQGSVGQPPSGRIEGSALASLGWSSY